jgi:hypothetical protein
VATTVSADRVSTVIVQLAVSVASVPSSVWEQSVAPEVSVNVTLPVGVPWPGPVTDTVADRVMVSPATGFAVAETDVDVESALTFTSAGDVLEEPFSADPVGVNVAETGNVPVAVKRWVQLAP